MPEIATADRLRGLILSATELKSMTKWPDALVEDYLNLLDNLITIADLLDIEIDQTLEEISTNFLNGSIPYVSGGFLAEDNNRLFWDATNYILKITGIISSAGRLKNSIIITFSDSPYDLSISCENVAVNTDGGPVQLNLPAGTSGEQHKITNVGSSNNDITLSPYGTELLNGFNESEKIKDSETFDLGYNGTAGWWV